MSDIKKLIETVKDSVPNVSTADISDIIDVLSIYMQNVVIAKTIKDHGNDLQNKRNIQ